MIEFVDAELDIRLANVEIAQRQIGGADAFVEIAGAGAKADQAMPVTAELAADI